MRRCRGGLAALAVLLLVAVARAQVEQEVSLETIEGTGINITCSHPKIQTSETIYWYRQLPGKGPELLVSTHKDSKDVPAIAGQLRVSADRRWSALWLGRPRRGDAAVYYCALGATGRGAGAAAGHEPPRAGPAGASRGRCRSARRGRLAPLGPGSRGAAATGTGTATDTCTDTSTGTESPTSLESPASLSPSSQHWFHEPQLPDLPSRNPIQSQRLVSIYVA
ncbi:uncharacterized protein LOC128819570 [Vidua macroura]|uniref:uncharacterized protein LOC128819570 n=1 Tax=Vidua macroura TaxID=187451 RepID=UPI0023A80DC0|nr:uncharacterized protein LOC128819570 [Vidua macroura]